MRYAGQAGAIGAVVLAVACRAREPETRIVLVTPTPAPTAVRVAVAAVPTSPLENSAEFDFPVPPSPPTEQEKSVLREIERLEIEMALLRAKILIQQVEAESSGGLVGALSSATLATMRQTLAMMEQRRFLLESQLPTRLVPTSGAPRRE